MASSSTTDAFKVLLVGDACVGKSAFLHKLMGCEFENHYIPTLGIEIHHIEVETPQCGKTKFVVYDFGGRDKYSLVFDQQTGIHFSEYDCAIIMYDSSSLKSYKNVMVWEREVERIWGNDIPIVVIRNKIDIGGGHIYEGPLECFGVSSRSDIGLVFPFIRLAEILYS